MQSNKLLENALKAVKEHPEVFEALEEYDKTRKLPRTTFRQRINLTIDSNLLRRFKAYAQKNNLNMSKVVEKHIKEELGFK